ncbi:MAG TPA: hypothetical protein VJY84_01405 [Candidatus Saccharimonadales bacterium]|nr:hypothetical protein [Candidatus Saccharimonadales bacterium]
MGFGEELKKLEPDKLVDILDRIYGELGAETDEAPDISETDYPALARMATFGFQRIKLLEARLRGEIPQMPALEASEEEIEHMDQFIRGVAIGVWAAAAAMKEYAELEKFERSAVKISDK